MRKFYFENGIGQRVGLNDEDGIFLYNPRGLGFEYGHTYSQSGDGFFFRTKDKANQLSNEFTLVFDPMKVEPYARFSTLMDWIASSEILYLIYCPVGTKEYYKRIDISSVDKTELERDGSLRVSTAVLPLTPWFLPTPIHVNFGEEDAEAMMYDFIYTDDLIYAVGSKDYTADVYNTGHIPAAVKVTYTGMVINPSFTLRGIVSREIYGICAVDGTFSADDTLILSTEEQNSYIKKIDGNGVETDLLDEIDITSEPFFRVPTTEPCELIISGESIYGTASMQLFIYYRGV